MKKNVTGMITALLVITGMVLAAGCAGAQAAPGGSQPGSAGSQPGTRAPAASPVIGKEGVPQPEWVRKKPQAADVVYFTGEGRAGKTVTQRKANARADAARQLAEWKEVTINSAVKDYVDEAGETGDTQSLERLAVASIQRAKANASGFQEVESWINPEGNYVGLYSYPRGDLVKDFRTETNNFVRKESAAFAEFKSEEMFRYLESEAGKPVE
ncbi:MAG: LPP20 family lipoprotein [Treponema sp.]|jgi:hypothetical protein|nr:LPP20 family lipoprotein [Treponema sp.]